MVICKGYTGITQPQPCFQCLNKTTTQTSLQNSSIHPQRHIFSRPTGKPSCFGGIGMTIGIGMTEIPPPKKHRTSLTQHLRLNTCYSPRLDAKSIKSTGRKMQRGRFLFFLKKSYLPKWLQLKNPVPTHIKL